MRRRRAVLLGPGGQLGHAVRHAARAASGPADVDLIAIPRATLDVAVPGAVERVLDEIGFDALVNCAAFTGVDQAEDDAGTAFAVNARAVGSMARVCAAKGARFFHISTDYVFGGNAARHAPIRESEPTAPINVYGASKAAGEALARTAWDNVVIVRVASLFGEGGTRAGATGNFVETVVRAGRERRALRVVDDQTMSPTSAADVATVLLRMLADGCAPGLYHVVNDGPATWFEFARTIVRLAGIDASVIPCRTADYPTRAARPRYSVLDNARISAGFGALPAWPDALERHLHAAGHLARRTQLRIESKGGG